MTYTIVGVIGHIDHGKTSLVGALTGIDTDTHPEEKRRGITIDIGFASFTEVQHEFALIDAPGHQKYIGNLLAGVSRVDLGLLVVACDQGIQAQTLEHASILQTLGVSKLIVAMSRIDLVDDAMRDELAEELEVFLADFGFTDIPMVPISSVTGQGIDEIKKLLCEMARQSDPAATSFFRMPIDRVFSVPGRGCVVAGTVWSGTVEVGDTIELASNRQPVRVRELEVHGESVNKSIVGRRTAMNITGVATSELSRGDELVGEGTHQSTDRVLVDISMFRETQELRCPAIVQFHTATTSCSARIIGIKQLKPGACDVVVVETDEPIVATFGQQCLFRKPYPVGSFAGGRIVAPLSPDAGKNKQLVEFGRSLKDADAAERLARWIEYYGEVELDLVAIELRLGIQSDLLQGIVKAGLENGMFESPRDGLLVAPNLIDRAGRYILKVLTAKAEETDDAWLVEEAVVQLARTAGSAEVIRLVIDRLVKSKQVVKFNKMVAVASEETVLSKKQRAKMEQILALFKGSRQPPTTKEVAAQTETTMDAVSSLVRFATQQNLLTDLGKGFLISTEVFKQLCAELHSLFQEEAEQLVPAIKDRWQVTRKHAIPILEYCDKMGITSRKSDFRTEGPHMSEFLTEQTVER